MRVVRAQELEEVRREVSQLLLENTRLTDELRALDVEQRDVCQQAMSWKQLWHAAMSSNMTLMRRLATYEQVGNVGCAGL